MNYKLIDLLDVPRLRDLLGSLDEIHSMPSAILDTDGVILTATAWQDICTKFHRINPETKKKCIESDRHIEAKLDDQNPYVIYRCPMGLVDAAIPIIIEGKHLGNVFTGQLFMKPPDKEYFIRQAHQYGFDEDEYLAAMSKVPLFPEDKLRKNLKFIHNLTTMLAEQGLQHKRQIEAENETRESKEKYQLIFENLRDVYYETSLDGTVLEISPSINVLSQFNREELIGKSLLKFYSDVTERDEFLQKLMQHGEVNDFEVRLLDKDGQQKFCSVNALLIRDHKNVPQKIVGSLRDISERKRAEEALRAQVLEYESSQEMLKQSEERYKALNDASFGGVIIHEQGRILDCNQSLSEISGYRHEELVGMDGLKLIAPNSLPLVLQNIKSGYDKGYEVEGIRKDGSIYPLAIRGKNVSYQGREVRIIEFRDITDRKQSEKALRESEERFAILAEQSRSISWEVDAKGLYTFVSPVSETVTGYHPNELVGKKRFYDLRLEEKREVFKTDAFKVFALKAAFNNLENPIQAKDGRLVWVSTNGLPMLNDNGILLGYRGSDTDITERKRAEEAIQKKLVALTQPLETTDIAFEELFNMDDVQRLQDDFARATGVASIITSPQGIPLTAPSNFTRLCSNIIRATAKGRANCFKSDSIVGRHNPDGPTIQPCLSGGLWDAGAGITVGGQHIANWLIGQVRDETQTEDTMLAYAREIGVDETTFMEAFEEVPSMSRQRFEQVAEALFTLASQLSNSAYQNIQQARFINERKLAEDALRQSETTFRKLFEDSSDAILLIDDAGVFVECNQAALDLLKMTRKQFLFMPPAQISPEFQPDGRPSAEAAPEMIALAYSKGLHRFDWTCVNAEGGEFIVEVSLMPVTIKGQSMLHTTWRDITERKQFEEERQQVEKLNSIGTLAGGLAHDFNNILAGLYGNIALAKTKFSKDCSGHPGLRFLEAAEKSMNRATLLTNQLLTFAKGGEPVKESLSLGDLVEEVVQFNLSGSKVKPVFSQAPNLWLAKVDQGQIQQVFSNLTINAKQAMPNGGHLYISLENVALNKNIVRDLECGKYIQVTVSDEGTGIAPEHLDQIFDPYFTTKQSGSGLGLATLHSIIKRHGGHISVSSCVGKGTTFTFYLPASDEKKIIREKIDAGTPINRSPAKILLLDDEETIRTTAAAMLEELSFTVETVSEGKRALASYQKALDGGKPFDLVILDLTIPGGMGGKETAQKILQIDPQARLIVSSGYADDPIMANFSEFGFRGVVSKPYNFSKLSASLSSVLERN